MPLGRCTDRSGSKVIAKGAPMRVGVGKKLKGRILDGCGDQLMIRVIDFEKYYPITNFPNHYQEKDCDPLPSVKAIDGLLVLEKVRVGIFAEVELVSTSWV